MENVMMPIARSKDQSGRVEAHYKREGGGSERRRGTWLVAGFCLPRDHGFRFPDRATFVAGSFQAFVGEFRPKLLQLPRCRFRRRLESTAFARAPANSWHFRQYIVRGSRRASNSERKKAAAYPQVQIPAAGNTDHITHRQQLSIFYVVIGFTA